MVKQIMFRYTYIDAYQKQQQTKMVEISKMADGENVDTSLANCSSLRSFRHHSFMK